MLQPTRVAKVLQFYCLQTTSPLHKLHACEHKASVYTPYDFHLALFAARLK